MKQRLTGAHRFARASLLGLSHMQIETDVRRHARSTAQTTGANAIPILLSDDAAALVLGVSRRKFHELRQEPWMPKPRVLGPRLLRWVRSELEQAALSIPQQQQAIEPAHLRRAKIERMKKRPHHG